MLALVRLKPVLVLWVGAAGYLSGLLVALYRCQINAPEAYFPALAQQWPAGSGSVLVVLATRHLDFVTGAFVQQSAAIVAPVRLAPR